MNPAPRGVQPRPSSRPSHGGRAGARWPPTWPRSTATSLANPALRPALTDTSVPGPARRAVLGDLLDGKVVGAATRRVASFAAGAVPRPRGARRRIDWLAIGPASRPRGRRRSSRLASATGRPRTGGRLRRRRLRGRPDRPTWKRSRTSCSGSPGPSRPPRRCAAPWPTGTCRPTVRQGRGRPAAGGQGAAGHPAAGASTCIDGRPPPGHRGHAGLAGRADGRGPGLAGGAGATRPERWTTTQRGRLAGPWPA